MIVVCLMGPVLFTTTAQDLKDKEPGSLVYIVFLYLLFIFCCLQTHIRFVDIQPLTFACIINLILRMFYSLLIYLLNISFYFLLTSSSELFNVLLSMLEKAPIETRSAQRLALSCEICGMI